MSLLIAPIVWFLDQWTKKKAEEDLSLNEKRLIFADRASLRLVYNRGAFLGLFKDKPIYLHVFTIAALVMILVMGAPYWFMGRGRLTAVGLALILGGATGNYSDRLTRGHVVDFLAFAPNHKVHFNLADFAVFIGAGLIVLGGLFGE